MATTEAAKKNETSAPVPPPNSGSRPFETESSKKSQKRPHFTKEDERQKKLKKGSSKVEGKRDKTSEDAQPGNSKLTRDKEKIHTAESQLRALQEQPRNFHDMKIDILTSPVSRGSLSRG